MSNVQQAYNQWAAQYDTNENKTRDVEADALHNVVGKLQFDNCLEIGCGTGKNTAWLVNHATHITAVDFSDAMLQHAKTKVQQPHVTFYQADIREPWHFINGMYQLVTFSLVLEHIDELGPVFEKVANILAPGGYCYVGELHPCKQYMGSQARYETEQGTQLVTAYVHHISDFTEAAIAAGLQVYAIHEFFDDNNRTGIPRILSLLFVKP
jgi:ubiquinone/menaquinone biosynthesis C-methylase UbiE